MKIDLGKFRRQLQRARMAARAAIELGDLKAVARLTCEAARLSQAIRLAAALHMEPV